MVAWKLNEQKRQHRERAQPLHRAKLGLLEKHADYVKRARDYHSKEDRLNKLREKASAKNKDEFYFGMIRSKTIVCFLLSPKGVHVQSRGNEAMSNDLVKVLKTQDAGYIRTQQAVEQGRVRRLQQQLDSLVDNVTNAPKAGSGSGDDDDMMGDLDDWDAFDSAPPVASTSSLGAAAGKKHIIFSDNLDKVRTVDDPSKILPKKRRTSSTSVTKLATSKKGKAKAKASTHELAPTPEELEAMNKATQAHRERLTLELDARQDRLKQFALALKELENQRLLMGKGSKKMIVKKKKDPNARIEEDWKGDKTTMEEEEVGIASGARLYKWKAQRKR
ncbi:BQ2448_3604 [Microbotryum intermedium]|uniref:BQ2448_3604 protein n=1 Tax=Microbotryum intermedium TaxID=269621 RepID=A0A238FAG4_9BASI|nr:BQ2448_3604 [Microbotryum intermedium]